MDDFSETTRIVEDPEMFPEHPLVCFICSDSSSILDKNIQVEVYLSCLSQISANNK